jgi:hypothetical protein
MKVHIKYIVLLLAVILNSCTIKKELDLLCTDNFSTNNFQKEGNKFFVKNISIEGSIYVIELTRNDSLFKVLTEYTLSPLKQILYNQYPNKNYTNKIEIGKSYNLELEELYKLRGSWIYNHGVNIAVKFNDYTYLIKMNESLYTTNSLKGLYLIE